MVQGNQSGASGASNQGGNGGGKRRNKNKNRNRNRNRQPNPSNLQSSAQEQLRQDQVWCTQFDNIFIHH